MQQYNFKNKKEKCIVIMENAFSNYTLWILDFSIIEDFEYFIKEEIEIFWNKVLHKVVTKN